jgi:hypothetical protein
MNKSKRYNKTRKIKRNKSRTKKRGGMFSRFFSKGNKENSKSIQNKMTAKSGSNAEVTTQGNGEGNKNKNKNPLLKVGETIQGNDRAEITIDMNKIINKANIIEMVRELENLDKLNQDYISNITLIKNEKKDRYFNGKIHFSGLGIDFSVRGTTKRINFIDYDSIVISFPKSLDINTERAYRILYN